MRHHHALEVAIGRLKPDLAIFPVELLDAGLASIEHRDDNLTRREAGVGRC